jgi:hypothetical protein
MNIHPEKVNVHSSVADYRDFILDVINGGDVW